MGRRLSLALIIISVFAAMDSPVSAGAIAYDFSRQFGNYEFAARMAITIDGNTLTLTIDNTSPYFEKQSGSQTFRNAPSIQGFSFGISNPGEIGIVSWDLKASAANDPSAITSIRGAGFQWQKSSLVWPYNNYVFQNYDNSGYLYSPDVSWAQSANSAFEYSTRATLEILFTGSPELKITENPHLKVFYPGFTYLENSDKFIAGNMVAAPEAGTLLLLGIGLIGVAVLLREMKR